MLSPAPVSFLPILFSSSTCPLYWVGGLWKALVGLFMEDLLGLSVVLVGSHTILFWATGFRQSGNFRLILLWPYTSSGSGQLLSSGKDIRIVKQIGSFIFVSSCSCAMRTWSHNYTLLLHHSLQLVVAVSLQGMQSLTQFLNILVLLLDGLNFQKAEGKKWSTSDYIKWLAIQNFRKEQQKHKMKT